MYLVQLLLRLLLVWLHPRANTWNNDCNKNISFNQVLFLFNEDELLNIATYHWLVKLDFVQVTIDNKFIHKHSSHGLHTTNPPSLSRYSFKWSSLLKTKNEHPKWSP